LEASVQKHHPNPARIFADFALIGIQSFGGGSSTFSLIHQTAIQRGWMSEAEFVRAWALVQIAPGINLVKLSVMIGYKLNGWPGILAAVSGMLLPSASATVLMTAGFTSVREITWIKAIMKGIIPAVIGLSFSMDVQMSQSIFFSAKNDGRLRLGAHGFILVGAALLMGLTQITPLLILIISSATAIGLFAIMPARKAETAAQKLP